MFILVFTLFCSLLIGQKDQSFNEVDKNGKTEVIGMVMDMNGFPLKGVAVFVDSVKAKAKTNKKGIYKIKIDSGTKLLTVYSEYFGLLSMEYTGQKKVSFLYKQDSKPLEKRELEQLGFKLYSKPKVNNTGYADFASVLDILDKRFYYARVINGKVKIGKGNNQFYGDSEPLLFIDDKRMPISVLSDIATANVESIRVIHNGSEAAQYGGLKAGNGVILIKLKGGF